jgi:hypothetical protein
MKALNKLASGLRLQASAEQGCGESSNPEARGPRPSRHEVQHV